MSTETVKSVKTQILETLEANGYKDRIGEAYGSWPHGCGLPSCERVCVQPEFSPIDGSHVLLITADQVQSWVLPIPYNHHDWQCRSNRYYRSPEEMLRLLHDMGDQPKGCWK